MAVLRRKGVTLIELMIVLAIISILILAAIWVYQKQLAKGRDAKRKADLDRVQNVLEDYLSDSVCYPETDEITSVIPGYSSLRSICNKPFAPYLSQLPCDPKNNVNYNYFYSYPNGDVTCKSWYKIYTKLEDKDDSIIEKVGCKDGCGPSNNYNYWVGSPNVTEVAQLPGEWWPTIPGVTPPPGGTPSPPPGGTPTPAPSPGVTPTPISTPIPTPTPSGIPCGDSGLRPICPGGFCWLGICSTCCPGVEYRCGWAGGFCCLPDPSCGL